MYPELFHLGSLTIHSYGVMLMIGFLAGIALSRRQARRHGLSPDVPLDLGVWILATSIILARLLYVGLNWAEYATRPLDILAIWKEGGLSFFGGLAGGILAGAVYSWRTRISFWLLADVITPGVALGYGLARIGCFLHGCCYGVPTTLPWAVVFPGPYPGTYTLPSHPTQIYAALGSFAIAGFLLWIQPRLKAQGQLFAVYLMLYGFLRGAVEILRRGVTGEDMFTGIPFTQAQVVCVFLLLIGAFAFYRLARRGVPNITAATPLPRKAA